jgi:WD40 repeat protein
MRRNLGYCACQLLAAITLLGTMGCGSPVSGDGIVTDDDALNADGSPQQEPLIELVVSSHDNSAVTQYVLRPNGRMESWRYIVPPQTPLNLWPHGLAHLPDGQLLVSARGIHRLRRYDLKSGALLAEFGASTPLNTPIATILGAEGRLYVTSLETRGVLTFNPLTGDYLGALAGPYSPLLNRPGGATWGPDGRLYIANDVGNTIARLEPGRGGVETFASPPRGTTPGGLTFGPDGHLYLSDQTNARVLRFDGKTGAYLGEFVPPGSGGMRHPLTITFDPRGDLYVCSYGSDALLRFDGRTGEFLSSVIPAGHVSALKGPTWVLIRPHPR